MDKLPLDDLKKWLRKVFQPSPRQQQKDGWACGLFVIMAVEPCTHCKGFEDVVDSKKELACVTALKALLALP